MSPVKRAACMLAAAAVIGVCARAVDRARPIRSSTGRRAAQRSRYRNAHGDAERPHHVPHDRRVQRRARRRSPRPTRPRSSSRTRPTRASRAGRSSTSRSPTTPPRSATASPCSSTWAAIHGNETPGAEDSLEFAYDVLLQAKTNPKVAALLDKVRLIDLPLDEPRRPRVQERDQGAAAPRRASCGPFGAIVPPATCTPIGRRPQPQLSVRLGLQHRRHASTARGSGPGSEPEVKNTMDIVPEQPGRDAGHPAHELARDLLPGPGGLRRPDAGPQQRLPRPRAGDGPRDRRRLHQRPRLRARLRDQRRDRRLVLLRDPRHRQHARARRRRRRLPAGAPAVPATARRPTTPAPPARARPPRRPPASRATRSATRSG